MVICFGKKHAEQENKGLGPGPYWAILGDSFEGVIGFSNMYTHFQNVRSSFKQKPAGGRRDPQRVLVLILRTTHILYIIQILIDIVLGLY